MRDMNGVAEVGRGEDWEDVDRAFSFRASLDLASLEAQRLEAPQRRRIG